MLWDEGGMGNTATGSEDPRRTGSTLGRSGRVEPEELEADFRGVVRRLRQSPLRRATPG